MATFTLLIDTVPVASPGMLELQRELTLSAHRFLPAQSRIVVLQNPKAHSLEESKGLVVENVHFNPRWFVGRWLWYHYHLPKFIKKYHATVFYSLSGIVSRNVYRQCATLTTVNNMVPFSKEQVQHFPLLSLGRLRLVLLKYLYVNSVSIATRVILHSQHALAQLSPYVDRLERKTIVVHTGISERLKVNRSLPPAHPYSGKPFLFCFSAIYWYKNQINLIEGYRRALHKDSSLPPLLIAGFPVDTRYVEQMESKIVRDGLGSHVSYLGVIPVEQVPGYLHHATINVFPSTCETNSVVQSEILGMHGVMACSTTAPMPEIADDAALLFDPYDPDSIASCILTICQDPKLQKELRAKAAKRTEALSWDLCGKAIWESASLAAETKN